MNHPRAFFRHGVVLTTIASSLVAACSGSSSTVVGSNIGDGGADNAGQTCTAASQCYPLLDDPAAIHGQITCVTQLQNGYCTHTCQTTADCCAVPDECVSGAVEICAPLESAAQMYCLLACAAGDIPADAGTTDATTYCQRFANPTFTCRSSGGGSANQKFCGP